MGIFDAVKGAADSHETQVDSAIERIGDLIDEKSGGQYAGQVDQAQDFLRDRIFSSDATHEQPPA